VARKPPIDFEKALAELERIVAELEQGDLPLEASLKAFERGIELTRLCQKELAAAEQKVRKLVGEGAAETLEALEDDSDG
jgi:exodeoxyribonuclease VII small subunit